MIRSIKWEPTLDDVATLLHQLDPREITYIVEQSLCGFYVPTIEFLKAVSHNIFSVQQETDFHIICFQSQKIDQTCFLQ